MNRRKPRIGFVTASFKEPYQMAVWEGALEAAKQRGYALIFACGGRLSSPVSGESPGNIAYSFMTPETVEGVLALSTAIGTFVGGEEIRAFCASFAPLPLVSVGISVEGYPFATVDNEAGMRVLVKHLIEAHGYRRFASISGPPLHQEADARSRALSETLASHGIAENPAAVFRGSFTSEGGRAAAEHFLSRGIIGAGLSGAQAVIAANDRMALAAAEALEERGIGVPRDVAVVGFDDIDESVYFSPPLTTVRQPLLELGRRALGLLIDRIEGRTAENVLLEPELIVRESCGCPPAAEKARRTERIAQRMRTRHASIVTHMGSALAIAADTRQILEAVSSGIRDLGIPRCYISLYETGRPPSEYSRLFEITPADPPPPPRPEGRRYLTRAILPPDVMDREGRMPLMFFPLYFDTDQLGFIVFEYAKDIPQFQEMIRDSVARAVKMADLIGKVRNHGAELEREVKAKTLELTWEMERRRLLEQEVIAISGEVMERVGQDLHDGLSQKLAALSMLAKALESRLSAQSHPDAAAARELVRFLNEAIVDTREIARGLYPAELEKNGLVPAVQELVTKARRVGGVDVRLEVKRKPVREDASIAIQIYRIVQEALGNALKHSRAGHIAVFMDADGDTVRVDIADDGIGIPEDLSGTKGMGLRIMLYRAKMMDAKLEIERQRKGTRISISGPLFAPAGGKRTPLRATGS